MLWTVDRGKRGRGLLVSEEEVKGDSKGRGSDSQHEPLTRLERDRENVPPPPYQKIFQIACDQNKPFAQAQPRRVSRERGRWERKRRGTQMLGKMREEEVIWVFLNTRRFEPAGQRPRQLNWATVRFLI